MGGNTVVVVLLGRLTIRVVRSRAAEGFGRGWEEMGRDGSAMGRIGLSCVSPEAFVVAGGGVTEVVGRPEVAMGGGAPGSDTKKT
jgi:hypothetical protein